MRRYFKYEEDPGAAPEDNWIEWSEWEGEWNTRQVVWYYNRWLSSVDEYWPGSGGAFATSLFLAPQTARPRRSAPRSSREFGMRL